MIECPGPSSARFHQRKTAMFRLATATLSARVAPCIHPVIAPAAAAAAASASTALTCRRIRSSNRR